MTTKPESDSPKGKNITIFVTEDLRKKVEKLKKAHFSAMQMNAFTGYLVEVGLEKEELRFKEEEIRNRVRLERAAMPEIVEPVFSQNGARSELQDKVV